MRSSNPVFSRRGFSRDNGHAGFNAAPQAGAATTGANPFAQGTAANPYATNPYAQQGTQPGAPAPARTDAMTIDDVVTRTAMTLGLVVVAAAIAWWVMPVDQANLGSAYGVAIGAAIIGFVLSLVNSFKRRPSPALILTYAAFEGVFLGIVSNIVSVYVAPGAAMQAVLGTMAVFAGVLIAYRTGLIRVTRRFYGFVMAAAIGSAVAPTHQERAPRPAPCAGPRPACAARERHAARRRRRPWQRRWSATGQMTWRSLTTPGFNRYPRLPTSAWPVPVPAVSALRHEMDRSFGPRFIPISAVTWENDSPPGRRSHPGGDSVTVGARCDSDTPW
ncbi:hypothetical protein SCYAM73S_02780 [Streptomyces cyaneofuscatus]